MVQVFLVSTTDTELPVVKVLPVSATDTEVVQVFPVSVTDTELLLVKVFAASTCDTESHVSAERSADKDCITDVVVLPDRKSW